MKKKKQENQYLITYLKGILMGISDLIPGISGGTIAFITGIYEKLIETIKNLTSKKTINILRNLLTGDFKKAKKQFIENNFLFLLTLFLGIFTAIFSGAHLISFLLNKFPTDLLSFFVGLILASSIIIYKEIEKHSKTNILFAILGFLIGFGLLFLIPKEIQAPGNIYLIFSGFLAVFALFLPGISGSFILLILGTYNYTIDLIKNQEIIKLIPFGIGAIIGIFIISRLITFLFKKDKCKTLYTLIGLVLGTLTIPICKIISKIEEPNITQISKLIILFLIGFYIVYLLEKKSKKS